eukprot:gb/GFBE01041790.1/.p1 GENE.gb/GFBE01041790.1/~~gb/GFBE01041790.1/.p1  ORF type:complete len:112 (+),score=21.47 gb/GFBE01041790.1/:1-336(+)
MDSLQKLASLPLVDNACASRANRDNWSYSVFCTEICSARQGDPGAVEIQQDDGVHVSVTLRQAHTSELLSYATAAITAYTEWRSKFSEGQYLTLLFYHAFMFLEVEDGLAI